MVVTVTNASRVGGEHSGEQGQQGPGGSGDLKGGPPYLLETADEWGVIRKQVPCCGDPTSEEYPHTEGERVPKAGTLRSDKQASN